MAPLNLIAFCDESYTGRAVGNGDRPFVIAGYVAPAKIWLEFEGWWNLALRDEHLSYFRMSDCENRVAQFEKMEPSERERIQDRFIQIITALKVAGIAVGVSQDALAAAHDELARFRVRRPGEKQSMVTPYLFAFELCVNTMLSYIQDLPLDESVDFVFDKQREFESRAHTVREILVNCEEYRNRHRIGSLKFRGKTEARAVPIQAADVLAYEVMRELSGHAAPRWQLGALRSGLGGVATLYYAPAEVTGFVNRLHAVVAAMSEGPETR